MSDAFDQVNGTGHYAPVDPPSPLPAPPAYQEVSLAPTFRVLEDGEHIKQTLIHNGYATSAAGGWASALMQAMISGPATASLTPKEIAVYCCDVAQHAVEEFTRRGWAIPMPSADSLIEKDGARGAGFRGQP